MQKQIETVQSRGRGVGAFIVEPIISCGGQIELPSGFLSKAYAYIRAAGGLCISDEVQVGCGRLGKTFWGFQLHNVLPDIVTIGKPLGNGHPLAAVVCTQEVAEKFANGMEYFNTFGGNPVSCHAANAVLDIIEEEELQKRKKQHVIKLNNSKPKKSVEIKLSPIKVGSRVRLKNSKQRGEVIDLEGAEATVTFGNFKTKVNVELCIVSLKI